MHRLADNHEILELSCLSLAHNWMTPATIASGFKKKMFHNRISNSLSNEFFIFFSGEIIKHDFLMKRGRLCQCQYSIRAETKMTNVNKFKELMHLNCFRCIMFSPFVSLIGIPIFVFIRCKESDLLLRARFSVRSNSNRDCTYRSTDITTAHHQHHPCSIPLPSHLCNTLFVYAYILHVSSSLINGRM